MMKKIQVAAAVALALSSASLAQQAVQWKVSDGGNGHWYRMFELPAPVTLASATAAATALGAHAVTVTSEGENAFVRVIANVDSAWASESVGPMIGLSVDSGQCSGGCWVSGEPVDFSFWHPGNPDNSATDNCVYLYQRDSMRWQNHPCGCLCWGVSCKAAIIEWDADCNNDGIVDYGQCRDGTLPDYNGNNIPDCFESGNPCVANLVVNGSFELGVAQPCGWICVGVGDGHLEGWEVTLNSVDRERTEPNGCNENWFASHGNYSVDMNGCSVGGVIRQSLETQPGRSYYFSFDMSLNPTNVSVGRLRIRAGSDVRDFEFERRPVSPQPNEHHEFAFVATAESTMIEIESLNREYYAQWNGPIIDAVRVVPSIPVVPTCHDADLYVNGVVNGADLAALLSEWGPVTPATRADINHDGSVNGADLSYLLSFWGVCP